MTRIPAWLLIACIPAMVGAPRSVGQSWQPKSALRSRTPVGIWEADDNQGGAVGINLSEIPWLWSPGDLLAPGYDGPHLATQLVGVYQRKSTRVRCGEENFYETGWREANSGISTAYHQDRLAFHASAEPGGVVPLDLDLQYDPIANVWVGRFHRGTFDMELTLRRAADRPSQDQEICRVPGNLLWGAAHWGSSY